MVPGTLKLTWHSTWKWMIGIRLFPLGMAYFQGLLLLVSGSVLWMWIRCNPSIKCFFCLSMLEAKAGLLSDLSILGSHLCRPKWYIYSTFQDPQILKVQMLHHENEGFPQLWTWRVLGESTSFYIFSHSLFVVRWKYICLKPFIQIQFTLHHVVLPSSLI